ncbi:SEFIR domain-containing protein [Methanolobus tindarius DSM 2278]|uniref:SEFIR domain-containing protein n=1 Tax=Methanolobus tindarius DSM 2278 TaxID=1090322 RepID=W9E139_METTI|nr:toll/interleukin-1 receptor domain-containing protein [Methanolobus tindarius]ETA69341.1 SEFIR domain-containing protein [Methanolobus tindarius DSM 2278]
MMVNLKSDTNEENNPTCFISYSWDNEEHKKWVMYLASKLQSNGIKVTLDEWHLQAGEDLHLFMEESIRNCDYVVIVLTPNYTKKANNREGGVGYENSIITGNIHKHLRKVKYIPIIKSGNIDNSIPEYLAGKKYISFLEERKFEDNLKALVHALYQKKINDIPPLGPNPFSKKETSNHHINLESSNDIIENEFINTNEILNEENNKYILIESGQKIPYLSSKSINSECIIYANIIHEEYENTVYLQHYEDSLHIDNLESVIKRYYSTFFANHHRVSAFSINQETCSWFGYGPLNFITAIKDQYHRYKDLKLRGEKIPHHEIAYFIDEWKDGIFFIGCQPSKVTKKEDSVIVGRVNIGFIFKKMPFDTKKYTDFFEYFQKTHLFYEPFKPLLKTKIINSKVNCEAFIIDNPHKEYGGWVCGIVGSNSKEINVSDSSFIDKIVVNFIPYHELSDKCEYNINSAKSMSLPTSGFTARIVNYKANCDLI